MGQDPPTDVAGSPRPSPAGGVDDFEIPRIPLRYDRAVLAALVLQGKLSTVRAAGRRDSYDVVVHQQAAMPEQLLPAHQEGEAARDSPRPTPRPVIDLRAIRRTWTPWN